MKKDEVTSEMIIQDEQELSEAEIAAMYYVLFVNCNNKVQWSKQRQSNKIQKSVL